MMTAQIGLGYLLAASVTFLGYPAASRIFRHLPWYWALGAQGTHARFAPTVGIGVSRNQKRRLSLRSQMALKLISRNF